MTFHETQSLAVLIVVILGFLTMLGIVSLRTVLLIVLGAMFLPSVLPAALSWISSLSPTVALFIFAWLGLAALRLVMRPLLGARAADSMAGNLAANLVTLMIQLFLLPFRVVGRLLGMRR